MRKQLLLLGFTTCSFAPLLTSAQNVGVGVASPQERLHVDGRVYIGTTLGTASQPSLRFNEVGLGLYRVSPNNLGLSTAGEKRLHVNESGNFAFGNIAPIPSARVLVDGNITLTPGSDRSLAVQNADVQNPDGPTLNLRISAGGAVASASGPPLAGGGVTISAGNGYANTNTEHRGGNVVIRSGGNTRFNPSEDTQWGDVVFETARNQGQSNREHMRIKGPSGNVGIGFDNPSQRLHVNGNILASGSITPNSDARLKRNVVPVEQGLALISALNPVSYDKRFSLSTDQYEGFEYGFLAQELQSVIPEIVSAGSDADALLAVNYNSLIAILVKAVQELSTQVSGLESELTSCAAVNSGQQSRLDVLTAELDELRSYVFRQTSK